VDCVPDAVPEESGQSRAPLPAGLSLDEPEPVFGVAVPDESGVPVLPEAPPDLLELELEPPELSDDPVLPDAPPEVLPLPEF